MSSEGTNSIKRFDGLTGAFIGDFVTAGSGGLSAPQGLAFGPDGHLYVSSVSQSASAILKYDGQSGAFLGQFNSGYSFGFAADLSWRNGILYAAEFTSSSVTGGIHRFDASGNHMGLFAATGSGSDGHLFASDGFFYAVASQQSVIKKFDSATGSFISSSSVVNGLLLDLREGSNGNLFVNNFNPGSVFQINKATGSNMGTFVSGLPTSQGQEIGLDGSLLVGTYAGNSILRFDESTGAAMGTFASGGGLIRPNNFVFGPDPVPEPASLVVVGTGILAVLRRRKRN